MSCTHNHGEGTVLETELFALGVGNPARARHDLRTLAMQLPIGLINPLSQLRALGDCVGAAFTTASYHDRDDAALLDVNRALLERHGDPLLVALIVATIGQGVGWDVAVVASEQRVLVAHRVCGPPFVLAVADEGRLIDATDLIGEGDLWWLCPHEAADRVRELRQL